MRHLRATPAVIVKDMETEAKSGQKPKRRADSRGLRRPRASGGEVAPVESEMAVSIAGVSTACSKDALVSSAKAVRKRLSTE